MDIKNVKRVSQLNDFLKCINWLIEDLENNGEVCIALFNKYSLSFDHSYIDSDDEETKNILKKVVIEALNNRIEEINKEIESL